MQVGFALSSANDSTGNQLAKDERAAGGVHAALRRLRAEPLSRNFALHSLQTHSWPSTGPVAFQRL